jgi:hypothetical protein
MKLGNAEPPICIQVPKAASLNLTLSQKGCLSVRTPAGPSGVDPSFSVIEFPRPITLPEVQQYELHVLAHSQYLSIKLEEP